MIPIFIFAVTNMVALFSHFASSSSLRATPSPPISGKFSGILAELLALLRPKGMRDWRFCAFGEAALLWCLRRRTDSPRDGWVGERSGGGVGRVGSPGNEGGSMDSWVVVVVRRKEKLGTSGERVGGEVVKPSSCAPSFFFFFRISLSGMVSDGSISAIQCEGSSVEQQWYGMVC